MEERKCKPDKITYATMAKTYAAHGIFDAVRELEKQMISTCESSDDSDAFNNLFGYTIYVSDELPVFAKRTQKNLSNCWSKMKHKSYATTVGGTGHQRGSPPFQIEEIQLDA
ncbi:Uncharacterized protein Rs2_23664 [Raphanus sativus]|nr:Uncharacterized protein Rs2_23664 [Raphanus sativus]